MKNGHLDSHRHGTAGGWRALHYAEARRRPAVLLFMLSECWYSCGSVDGPGDRYHVVAPDLRGYNLSDKPPRVEDYRMELLVDDVLGLVRHFGAREAAIVGHDWGAGVAWAVAQRHPEYVWKLAALQVPPMAAWRKNLTLKQALRSWYMLFFQIPCCLKLMRGGFRRHRARVQNAVRAPKLTMQTSLLQKALREPFALTAAIN